MSYWFEVGSAVIGTSRIIGYGNTPLYQTFAIAAEARVLTVELPGGVYAIGNESRVNAIDSESRTLAVPAEDRIYGVSI